MLKSTEYRSGAGTQSYVHIRALQKEMRTALAKQTWTIWGVIVQHVNTPAIARFIPRLCDDILYDSCGYSPSLSPHKPTTQRTQICAPYLLEIITPLSSTFFHSPSGIIYPSPARLIPSGLRSSYLQKQISSRQRHVGSARGKARRT